MAVRSEGIGTHFHPDIELLYVISGAVEVELPQKQFCLEKDDVFVINANVRHSLSLKEDALLCSIRFSYQLFYDYYENYNFFFWCNSALKKGSYDHLRGVLKKLLICYISDEKEYNSFGQMALFYEIMNILIKDFAVCGQEDPVNSMGKDAYRMQMINNYIDANYQSKMSLEALADQLYLSVAYLSRYIKKNFGMNFGNYVTSVRLRHAMDALLQTQQPITKIAMDNGFSSIAVFNKEFKNAYGLSPSYYRREHAGENKKNVSDTVKHQYGKERLAKLIKDSPESVMPENMAVEHHVQCKGAPPKKYNAFWKRMINIGPAQRLLDATVRSHIALMRERMGFLYVRFWNLLDDDLMINAGSGLPLNFSKLDGILDDIVDNGMLPVIEFGIKPEKIHKNRDEYVVMHPRKVLSMGADAWDDFIIRLLEHYIRRYGREHVSQWIFELWNGDLCNGEEDAYSFAQAFERIYKTAKGILPELTIGGGGARISFDDRKLGNFPESWGADTQPDFISFMLYNVLDRSLVGEVPAPKAPRVLLLQKIAEVVGLKRLHELEQVPFYITEWNMTLSDRNYLNDSSFKGAYIISTVLRLFDQADVLAYFSGSDYISDYLDTDRVLFGGSGLLTKNGIEKPAAFAFEFLHALNPYLVARGENYIVTTDGKDSFTVLCHNCKNLSDFYFVKKENEIEMDEIEKCFSNLDHLELKLSLDGVADGIYSVKEKYVSETKGSVLGLWKSLGYSQELNKEEMRYLKEISQPQLRIFSVKTQGGLLPLHVTLEANAFALISCRRQEL